MSTENFIYSPDILIYLEVGRKRIRVADVLYNSATLFETAELPPYTKASLVFAIDGVEEREEVVLNEGIRKDSAKILFSYSDPERLNGRHFS